MDDTQKDMLYGGLNLGGACTLGRLDDVGVIRLQRIYNL